MKDTSVKRLYKFFLSSFTFSCFLFSWLVESSSLSTRVIAIFPLLVGKVEGLVVDLSGSARTEICGLVSLSEGREIWSLSPFINSLSVFDLFIPIDSRVDCVFLE